MGYPIPHHQRKILKYGINKWPVDICRIRGHKIVWNLNWKNISTHKLAISMKAFQTWKLYFLYVRNIYKNDYCNT